MIAIDTNVLVRIFVDDESFDQVKKARNLAKKSKKIFIAQTVQIELIWVLLRAFKLKKDDVLKVLDELYSNATFVLQNEEEFTQATELFRSHPVDFSDCVILVNSNKIQQQTLYTFDKKFANLPGVELVK